MRGGEPHHQPLHIVPEHFPPPQRGRLCCRRVGSRPSMGVGSASWAGAPKRGWEREAPQILKYQHRLGMPGTSSLRVKDGTKTISSTTFPADLQIQTRQRRHLWHSPTAGRGQRLELMKGWAWRRNTLPMSFARETKAAGLGCECRQVSVCCMGGLCHAEHAGQPGRREGP